MSGTFHRVFRAITRSYPYTTPAYEINVALAPLLDRETPLWLEANGYRGSPRMMLNVRNRFQRKIFYFPVAYARHWLQAPLGEYMRQRLRPGDWFVDIGANIGYYSLLAAGLVGAEGTVMSFEPEPGAFESLTRTMALNECGQVQPHNVGLSNREGKLQLYRARDTSHSLVEATEKLGNFRGTVDVDVYPLDRFPPAAALDGRVRLIKVDVEGEEARVAQGMLETLARIGKPPVWSEVRGPEGSERAPDTFAPMLEALSQLGYRAFRWRKDGITEVTQHDVRKREDILFAVDPNA
ncbi:MAG TPA: FkbM family methyltransferase [Kofleriaceae bacterium]|nr:FkbM family methyltransferase [Kofleriaceae bacterium]